MLRSLSLLSLALILLAGCAPQPIAPSPSHVHSATPAPPVPPAQDRLTQGRSIVAAAPGDPFALRAAFDQFSLGLLLASPDDPIHTGLVRHQTAAALLLDATNDERAAAELCAEAQVLWPEAAAAFSACSTPALASPTAPAAAPTDSAPRTLAAPRPAAPRPTAAPQPPRFGVIERRSFEGSAPSGQYSSCIDIQIRGRNGPIGGAVVGINNGEHSYQNQTDANGYTGRCGLGASTWSVVLFWVPPDQPLTGATTTVWVNGAAEQRAAMVFQEQ